MTSQQDCREPLIDDESRRNVSPAGVTDDLGRTPTIHSISTDSLLLWRAKEPAVARSRTGKSQDLDDAHEELCRCGVDERDTFRHTGV